MSSWQPRTSAKGGLPRISLVMPKPRPLGIEFKDTYDGATGMMRWLEVQGGKVPKAAGGKERLRTLAVECPFDGRHRVAARYNAGVPVNLTIFGQTMTREISGARRQLRRPSSAGGCARRILVMTTSVSWTCC